MRDLKEFVEDYLLAGIIWGTVAVGVVFLLLCLIVLDVNQKSNTKQKLFLATSGIKTDDKGVDEAGKIISDFLKGAFSIKEIEKFSELSDTYKNIFWSNSDIFIKIAREKSKAPKVEIIGWMPFSKWSLIIGLFFLSLSMTINFFVRIINIASSLKDCFWWPFKKVWSYPLFLFMFPGLLIGILIIGLVWFIVIIFKNLILGFVSFVIRKIMISEGMITERRRNRFLGLENEKETEKENKLEQAKIKAKEMIDAANASVQESRMKFAEINLRELEDKKGKLESKVNNCRYNLSSLAEKIEQSQRDLAKSSKELREWEDNFPNIRNQKQDDYFKEFDKILSLNGIEAVEIKDEDFFAYTGTIFIDYAMQRFEIGMFRINLNNLRIENLTSTHPKGEHHPYASQGDFCWGNLGNDIHKARHRKEYCAALSLILKAMRSAEGDNVYKVAEWRKVPIWEKF